MMTAFAADFRGAAALVGRECLNTPFISLGGEGLAPERAGSELGAASGEDLKAVFCARGLTVSGDGGFVVGGLELPS